MEGLKQELLEALPVDLHEMAASIYPRRIQRCLTLLDQRVDGVIVAAESIYRRHNVSAILRSAEAFGVHEAHLICNAFTPVAGVAAWARNIRVCVLSSAA